jgi:predicted heme/steroid binding protein
MKQFSVEEVAQHNKAGDCWIVIDNKVFDVSNFLKEHPGGSKVVLKLAGKDATKEFKQLHAPDVLTKYAPQLCIGEIAVKSESKQKDSQVPKNTFGELVAYGDPNWYQGWNTTYYNDSHRRFREAMRAFVEKEIMPYTVIIFNLVSNSILARMG